MGDLERVESLISDINMVLAGPYGSIPSGFQGRMAELMYFDDSE